MKIIPMIRWGMLCLIVAVPLQTLAQLVDVVQTRRVDQENISEFIERETTYWQKVAEKAIADGKLTGWSLWQRVDGFDVHKDHNFAFVNSYTPEQFNMEESIWNHRELFPRKRIEDISTFGISEVQDVLFYEAIHYVEKSPPNFIRVNFADASNLGSYLEGEMGIWAPFVEERMDSGKTNVVSWLLSRLIIPRGRDMPHNAVTVDGFATLGDALGLNGGNFSEDTEMPDDVDKIFEVHSKAEVHIYQLVAQAATPDD